MNTLKGIFIAEGDTSGKFSCTEKSFVPVTELHVSEVFGLIHDARSRCLHNSLKENNKKSQNV